MALHPWKKRWLDTSHANTSHELPSLLSVITFSVLRREQKSLSQNPHELSFCCWFITSMSKHHKSLHVWCCFFGVCWWTKLHLTIFGQMITSYAFLSIQLRMQMAPYMTYCLLCSINKMFWGAYLRLCWCNCSPHQ